jgi:hypothetical protein
MFVSAVHKKMCSPVRFGRPVQETYQIFVFVTHKH